MIFNEELQKEWFRAVRNDNANYTNDCVKAFKHDHPQEYAVLNAFYHLRVSMRKDIETLSACGDVYWFTLTFDNKHDKSKIESKRKSATRFLNDCFFAYEMIEEFGEDNGRYHIHGFGVFRQDKGFQDFIKWPSRTKIQCLKERTLQKKIKYLTDYTCKQLPRRRRSKSLVYLSNKYKELKGFKKSFSNCWSCYWNVVLCKCFFMIYN